MARVRQFIASEPEVDSDSAYAPTISPARQARQISFLLIFGAEINDGQSTDAGVSAPGRGKSRIFRDVVGDHGGA